MLFCYFPSNFLSLPIKPCRGSFRFFSPKPHYSFIEVHNTFPAFWKTSRSSNQRPGASTTIIHVTILNHSRKPFLGNYQEFSKRSPPQIHNLKKWNSCNIDHTEFRTHFLFLESEFYPCKHKCWWWLPLRWEPPSKFWYHFFVFISFLGPCLLRWLIDAYIHVWERLTKISQT